MRTRPFMPSAPWLDHERGVQHMESRSAQATGRNTRNRRVRRRIHRMAQKGYPQMGSERVTLMFNRPVMIFF